MATTADQAVDLQRRFTSATVAPRGVGAGLQSQGLHAESANTSEPNSAFFRPQNNLDGRAPNANYSYTPVLDTSSLRVPASSSSPRQIGPSAVPRFASMIAMDERATPPSPGATAASTFSTHQKHPILNGVSEYATERTGPSFAQPLVSEPWKNGHVRQPSSPARRRQIESQVQPNRGHKRTATGDVKVAVSGTQNQFQANGANGHSRTMSLDSTGSKIAELSAQLRSRLSYAAAKVEKNWQGQQQTVTTSNRLLKLDHMRITGGLAARSRQSHNGSPEGTIISAPETFSAPALHMNETSEHTRSSMPPQTTSLQPPKLAPPVTIVSANNPNIARRRPNPNETNSVSGYNPHPHHRRYNSEQEGHPYNSNLSTISGTPSFNSSSLRSNGIAESPMSSNRSPVKRRTPSQNALMEQDAIETLLFMSSPENSGYHVNSQPRQTNVSVSIEAQIESSFNGNTQTSSQGSNISNSRNPGVVNFFNPGTAGALPASSIGLEAQAGDEIDRLLDQMETDNRNDAETRLSPYDFTHLGQ